MLSTTLPPIAGIRLGTSSAGIKYTNRKDLLLIEMDEGGMCAGVFTRNAFCAAPVVIARRNLANNPRWLLVNSGNANAGTGRQGMDNAEACCKALAELLDTDSAQVLPFSTGVIGENLPVDRMVKVFPELTAALDENGWEAAARAIMTTDTRPKMASVSLSLEGKSVTISGIAKGSGMIHPNMATMLGFIGTDAGFESQALLQKILGKAVNRSFNRITVDGDTSTNDACMLMGSGKSGVTIAEQSPSLEAFSEALGSLCAQLAEEIVRDGEGATKFIRIKVDGARSDAEAHQVANTIALSPLVKTAFFASDPNWGRILAAVGRAGVEQLDVSLITIYLGDVCIVRAGERASDYTEEAGQRVMNESDIEITVTLGRGDACQTVTTCDFSYDYVRINAEYRS